MRLQRFVKNRKKIGTDLPKKILVYTLMMKKETDQATFFDHLMTTHWFKETVMYFRCRGEFSGETE